MKSGLVNMKKVEILERAKPEIVSVIVRVDPDIVLVDRRNSHWGQIFGSVRDMSKQYGIKLSTKDNLTTLSGPKSRMQTFVEKLHFSSIMYKVI